MFADDSKFYRLIHHREHATGLQKDLDVLWDWTKSNHLFLNPAKCFFISFSSKQKRTETSYNMNGKMLSYSNTARDLGVIFDEKLTIF